MSKQDLNCPKCERNDMVQKVTSVYQGGISEVHTSGPAGGVGLGSDGKPVFVGGITTQSGYSQTYLSQRLAPPPKPNMNSSHIVLVLIGLTMLGVSGFCVILAPNQSGGVFGCVMYLIAILFFGGMTIGFFSLANNQAKRSTEAFSVAMPLWEKAIERWNKVYYCYRDDGVFLPGEGEFVPIAGFYNYLHR